MSKEAVQEVERQSDQTSSREGSALEHAPSTSKPRARYAFGCQGTSLMRIISTCGAVGFMLFGYDQGVLGVRTSTFALASAKGRYLPLGNVGNQHFLGLSCSI
jgi:hypothetical protein